MVEPVVVEFLLATTWLGGVLSLGTGGDDEDDGFELFGGRVGVFLALERTGMWVEVEEGSDWWVGREEAWVAAMKAMAVVDSTCWGRHNEGDTVDSDEESWRAAVDGMAELIMLCKVVDLAGMSSTKSMTCMPDGTVDLAFAFFCLRLLLVLSWSLILCFKGLTPRMAKRRGKKIKTHNRWERYGVRVSRPDSLASWHQSGYLMTANCSTFQSPSQ